jgi:MFS family permease
MTRDLRLLFASTFLRSLATGTVGILLGIYLAKLDLDEGQIGLVIGSGLAGNAVFAALATVAGDRLGRRRLLAVVGFLGALGGGVLAFASHPVVLMAAGFLGMVNGMGRDRGASLVLEQAAVPSLADDANRTRVFAWYNVLGDVGHALGGLLATLPAVLRRESGLEDVASLRSTLALCAGLALLTMPLSLALSKVVESPGGTVRSLRDLSPETRRIVARLAALLGLDALGGGFLTTAWLSYFFYEHFHVGETGIGLLFVGARVMNALSHLGAAWLAKRIGLVNTMVFTHMPSSVLLLTVLIAPNFPVAAILFLLREGLSQMDVPTRQSYIMAVVQPEERTAVSGITHLVRLGAWAAAPFAAGYLMKGISLESPFVLGAALKIAYDALLWISFRKIPPPEERGEARPVAQAQGVKS